MRLVEVWAAGEAAGVARPVLEARGAGVVEWELVGRDGFVLCSGPVVVCVPFLPEPRAVPTVTLCIARVDLKRFVTWRETLQCSSV